MGKPTKGTGRGGIIQLGKPAGKVRQATKIVPSAKGGKNVSPAEGGKGGQIVVAGGKDARSHDSPNAEIGTHAEEMLKKVKRTVGWYNSHAGLTTPIMWKSVASCLEAIDPGTALEILSGLKEIAHTIRDPTSWIKKAAQQYAPELDRCVKTTIGWYNTNGGLQQQIHYDEVAAPLASIPTKNALHILKSLGEKISEIRDPTWWIISGCRKEMEKMREHDGGQSFETDMSVATHIGLDTQVAKNVEWYNKNGGLKEGIDLSVVAPLLAQLDKQTVFAILKGLDGKGAFIAHPTSWLASAVQKTLSSDGSEPGP